MSRTLLLTLVALAAACVPSLVRGRGSTARELRELGRITVPTRLEPRAPEEADGYALFTFDRVASWPMGSSTPVAERLVVGAWTPASRDAARERATARAADRLRGVVWRREGTLDVGDGVYEVNASRYPAWLVVREVEARGLTIAYTAWRKDVALDRARAVVDDAARSFAGARPTAEYLAIARERPAAERRARLRALDAQLAARGVRLTLDGGPVERDGAWYELYTDAHRGLLFAALRPLGALPRATRFEHRRPPPARGVGTWPDVIWYATEGARVVQRDFDGDLLLSEALDARLAARHAGAPERAHFYTARVFVLDAGGKSAVDPDAPDLDWLDRSSGRLAALFAAGEVVR